MEFRHLRYFMAVAQCGSFSLAAKKLAIAQPPLSQQIKQLEEELGIVLFDRSNRGVLLTQSGKDFYRDASKIIEDVNHVKQSAEKWKQGDFGSIQIGLITAMATSVFADLLRQFRKTHPNIKLGILDLPSAQQGEAILKGRLDVGFLGSGVKNKLMNRHLIYKEAMVLAVPKDHRLAHSRVFNWTDLAQEDFVLIHPDVAPGSYYGDFNQRCRESKFEPKVSIYTSNVATQLWMIAAGFGIAPVAIVPSELGELKREGVIFKSLPGKPIFEEMNMMWRRSDLSPALLKFVHFMKNKCK